MFEPWFIFALIAVFMYGTTQFIVKIAFGKISVVTMIIINFLITMPIYITFLISSIMLTDILQYSAWILGIGILAALLGRAGYYAYLEAIESGPITIVGSITAAYPAIIAILALTILNESMTVTQGFGVAMVIGGIIAISFSSNTKDEKRLDRRSIFFCLVTLALWGTWGLFAKMALDVLPVGLYLGMYTIALPIVLTGYLTGKKIKIRGAFPKWSLPVIIAIIAVEIGQIGLFSDTIAVSMGNASVVFPLIAAYPIVTIIEAQTFLKERLARKDILIVMVVILGVLLVSTI